MFTRQHYQILQFIFSHYQFRNEIIDELCKILKKDSPRFDENRFRQNCNPLTNNTTICKLSFKEVN